ncbi:MAG TPA: SUMF1/EgtB/PvdO family nonheme iron enzyme [Candidatus Bathyarchaeia archaeon]|nr:SUMF1/EgtB/PvdO family nonheme iron enzyme [Candidatus Bathyarchaeia archaeon]
MRTGMAAVVLLCFATMVLASAEKVPWPADAQALHRAITDLTESFPERYSGALYLERLDAAQSNPEALAALQREALLANPLLADFDRILVVKRDANDPSLGLPANWQGNCSLPLAQYHNEIATVSRAHPEDPLVTLFKPPESLFVGDVDLEFDAARLLFSMPGSHGRSQIWEIGIDGGNLRQVTPGEEPDVDNYDACYLPDGRIVYASTACYLGIPCVSGSDSVANLCIMNADGTGIRMLCFDQDHNWCPTMLNNGRVLYTRWEYSDLPHSNTRLLFHMNPDGTGQMEFYGSNSYWPTAVMYARAVPGHPTKVAAIVTGHHGVRRMGELVMLDPARGRHEADGAVQRIPGCGKPVEPIVIDNLADQSWPKFLHPYPLSEKYLLVACQPRPDALWGIYLADVFDNLTLIREEPGWALFEPIPVKPSPRPPVIPDKVKPGNPDAAVYLADVYAGPGLQGIPRGAVKALRVFAYAYSYRKIGGLLGMVGMDGPWDVKRILGTVPVEPDGSAFFRVPANTPLAVQPLDEKGRALQLMRSWFTAMPGEVLSCAGCHEKQNSSPPTKATIAARRSPVDIAPWRGAARGFNFAREVQPVIDQYCVSCHDGRKQGRPDLRGSPLKGWASAFPGSAGADGGKFSVAYAALHRYVRRPGIESDYHLLTPMEFHASTTELVQILETGHHGVNLDPESWDRINTWIDLNAPFHGTWSEIGGESVAKTAERRRELMKKYANLDVDQEAIVATEIKLLPQKRAAKKIPVATRNRETRAARRRAEQAEPVFRSIDLGSVMMDLALIPAGSKGPPFWMGRFEVTNEQYARFDPSHDSGVESMHAYQFGIRGYPVNGPQQPVVRVPWSRAAAFCAWLAERTGEPFALPTEDQWERACRAGAHTPFWFGEAGADYSLYANLGDKRLAEFARNTYIQVNLLEKPNIYDDWVPRDDRFDDGIFLTAEAGRYAPNRWGLYDMHGNVWEWTSSSFGDDTRRIVRGGSWYDRPYRATADYRLAYSTYQPVFNVGFRVVCPAK